MALLSGICCTESEVCTCSRALIVTDFILSLVLSLYEVKNDVFIARKVSRRFQRQQLLGRN